VGRIGRQLRACCFWGLQTVGFGSAFCTLEVLSKMALTVFGVFAVTAMLVCYALETRSPWFIFAFAISCVLASAYGFLQGAWPFGLVEAVWCIVALRRWRAAINTSP